MDNQTKSAILLFIAPMLWGVAFVMQCMVDTTAIGTLTFNAGRFLLGAVSLLPIIAIFEKEPQDVQKMEKTVLYGAIT